MSQAGGDVNRVSARSDLNQPLETIEDVVVLAESKLGIERVNIAFSPLLGVDTTLPDATTLARIFYPTSILLSAYSSCLRSGPEIPAAKPGRSNIMTTRLNIGDIGRPLYEFPLTGKSTTVREELFANIEMQGHHLANYFLLQMAENGVFALPKKEQGEGIFELSCNISSLRARAIQLLQRHRRASTKLSESRMLEEFVIQKEKETENLQASAVHELLNPSLSELVKRIHYSLRLDHAIASEVEAGSIPAGLDSVGRISRRYAGCKVAGVGSDYAYLKGYVAYEFASGVPSSQVSDYGSNSSIDRIAEATLGWIKPILRTQIDGRMKDELVPKARLENVRSYAEANFFVSGDAVKNCIVCWFVFPEGEYTRRIKRSHSLSLSTRSGIFEDRGL